MGLLIVRYKGDVVTVTLQDGNRGISLGGLSNKIRAA
jgi:hypothetical protein